MSDDNPRALRRLSSRSITVLFVVGAVMLVAPLGIVLSEANVCKSNPAPCVSSSAYKDSVTFLPYVMIGGGVMIAYNMKRISDSLGGSESDGGEDDGIDQNSESRPRDAGLGISNY